MYPHLFGSLSPPLVLNYQAQACFHRQVELLHASAKWIEQLKRDMYYCKKVHLININYEVDNTYLIRLNKNRY